MSKNTKIKLREAIDELFSLGEAKPRPQQRQARPQQTQQKQGETQGGKREYADIKRSFEKLGGPSMVDIMKLTGVEDDEKGVNRSLFRKKVKQIKNADTGSYYQFDEDELAKVRAAIDIK